MLQMCLLASKDVSRQALLLHNLSEGATGRRKEVEFLCWAPYHLLLLTGKNSVHGELTPMYFMLHCLASPRFHPSMEMAWRGHTCQEQLGPSMYLCRKQMGHGKCWNEPSISIGAEKYILSMWQWFGECFLSSGKRINIILPLDGKDSNSTILPQGNADSSALYYSIFPFYKTSNFSIILMLC